MMNIDTLMRSDRFVYTTRKWETERQLLITSMKVYVKRHMITIKKRASLAGVAPARVGVGHLPVSYLM